MILVHYRRFYLSPSCRTPSRTVLWCRKKNHFLFHWSTSTLPEQNIRHWMYCGKNILKIAGRWMEKENYQMHWQVSQDLFFEWKASWRIYMVWCETDEGTNRPQDRTMYGHRCGSTCLMHRSAKQSKSGLSTNQNSIMPDNYVVSSSLNQMMKILNTMKNARRKWEIPMPAAMPCKTPANCRRKTCRNIGEIKTKYACSVEADESTRIRLEGAPYRFHEDHIAAKGMNSLSHDNLVRKIILMPQAMKKTRC